MNHKLRIKDYEQEENAEKHQKIYSFRKSPDSSGVFGLKKTGRINWRIISKNSKTQYENFDRIF